MISKKWLILGAFLVPFNAALADIAGDLAGYDEMSAADQEAALATAVENADADGLSRSDIYAQLQNADVPADVAAKAITDNLPADPNDAADVANFQAFQTQAEDDGVVFTDTGDVSIAGFEAEGDRQVRTSLDSGDYTEGTTGSGGGGTPSERQIQEVVERLPPTS